MKQEKGFIKYIVIVLVILAAVFLSQQSYSRGFGKELFSKASEGVYGYWAKGSNWVTDKMYSKVNEEVQKRGEIIKEEIASEKEKVSEDIGGKIKNYFSGIADSVIHPENNSCETSSKSSE